MLKRKSFLWKSIEVMKKDSCWDRVYLPSDYTGISDSQESSSPFSTLNTGQFSSVQSLSCLTLCVPMDCSTPDFLVHHQLPETTQTHVHWAGDAIQPSHPLSSPFPPTFNHSQHQGLFKWVSSLHQVAKVLEFQLQHQSFQWIFGTDLLQDWLIWFPCRPRDSQESSTPQFRSISSLALRFL